GNAPRYEVVPHRAGTSFTELLIVCHRAPLVGAPVDGDLDVGVRLQPFHITIEDPGIGRSNVRLVKVEMHPGEPRDRLPTPQLPCAFARPPPASLRGARRC